MKRILHLLIFLSLAVSTLANAQDIGFDKRTYRQLGFYDFPGSIRLPHPVNPNFPTPLEGQLAYNPSLKSPVYYNGVEWLTTGFHQFTDTQKTALLALIYTNNSSTFTLSPSSGERGVSQAVNVNYSITTGDDIFSSASINQSVGAATWNDGAHSVSGGTKTQTTTYTLTKNFTRNGTATTQTQNATYTSYVPQWAGISADPDFTNYTVINNDAGLQKFIQPGTAINKSVTPSEQYVWIISISNSLQILDGNNFPQTIGDWGTAGVEFWKKQYSLTLSDAVTVVTVYFYRTRITKTFTDTITYKTL